MSKTVNDVLASRKPIVEIIDNDKVSHKLFYNGEKTGMLKDFYVVDLSSAVIKGLLVQLEEYQNSKSTCVPTATVSLEKAGMEQGTAE